MRCAAIPTDFEVVALGEIHSLTDFDLDFNGADVGTVGLMNNESSTLYSVMSLIWNSLGCNATAWDADRSFLPSDPPRQPLVL